MKRFKRIFVIVADSMGVGAMPDAVRFKNGEGNDSGADTFGALLSIPDFKAPFLTAMGIGNIQGVKKSYPKAESPIAAYGKMKEVSAGKDTVTGHWELCGLVSEKPMPTFEEGFPAALLDRICQRWGRGYICNKAYSGTEVICDYGREHMESGKLIVYTSADSVFQIAAHEDVVSVDELYRCCQIAREELSGKYSVGRVIARPFSGEHPFIRTANRRDYALEPEGKTLCDILAENGFDVIGVGKIGDIFAHKGVTEEIHTESNTDGMEKTLKIAKRAFHGLCFVNLVDFDMKYGHRRDTLGYAKAVMELDLFMEKLCAEIGEDDLVILTADHGCDPSHIGTDHTREYVPLLVYGKNTASVDLGVRESFADMGKTVAELLGLDGEIYGKGFAAKI